MHVRNLTAFLFLLTLIMVAYSNTYRASWHFDDYPNIVLNPRVHIGDLSRGSIRKVIFESTRGQAVPYRPISYLSFALNWYVGGDQTIGFHITNTLVHFFTAFFLFLAIRALFNSPKLSRRHPGRESFIALLAATLWALNPIQTEAVSYIVQRMASMATMFYVLGTYFYLKSRNSSSPGFRATMLFFVFFSFALSLGSKENAATLPVALVLIEAVFFRDLEHGKTKRVLFRMSIGSLLLSMVAGAILFKNEGPFSFLEDYGRRPFTILERLITEPRIVLFYLTQILLPLPSRLSIQHDVIVSTSLFDPWTTIPAMTLVLLLLGFGFSQMRKRPLIAFAILFYFLNHLMESTIAPMELVFEHRNYLPSLFLFLPLSAGLVEGIDYTSRRKRTLGWVPVLFIVLIIIGITAGTFDRNRAWYTEKTLWADAMVKAPGSSRPYHNLAVQYHLSGFYDEALGLYEIALQKSNLHSIYSKADTYVHMAYIYADRGELEKAVQMAEGAVRIDPESQSARLQLSLVLTKLGRTEEAKEHLSLLFSDLQHPAHGRRRSGKSAHGMENWDSRDLR